MWEEERKLDGGSKGWREGGSHVVLAFWRKSVYVSSSLSQVRSMTSHLVVSVGNGTNRLATVDGVHIQLQGALMSVYNSARMEILVILHT